MVSVFIIRHFLQLFEVGFCCPFVAILILCLLASFFRMFINQSFHRKNTIHIPHPQCHLNWWLQLICNQSYWQVKLVSSNYHFFQAFNLFFRSDSEVSPSRIIQFWVKMKIVKSRSKFDGSPFRLSSIHIRASQP